MNYTRIKLRGINPLPFRAVCGEIRVQRHAGSKPQVTTQFAMTLELPQLQM